MGTHLGDMAPRQAQRASLLGTVPLKLQPGSWRTSTGP